MPPPRRRAGTGHRSRPAPVLQAGAAPRRDVGGPTPAARATRALPGVARRGPAPRSVERRGGRRGGAHDLADGRRAGVDDAPAGLDGRAGGLVRALPGEPPLAGRHAPGRRRGDRRRGPASPAPARRGRRTGGASAPGRAGGRGHGRGRLRSVAPGSSPRGSPSSSSSASGRSAAAASPPSRASRRRRRSAGRTCTAGGAAPLLGPHERHEPRRTQVPKGGGGTIPKGSARVRTPARPSTIARRVGSAGSWKRGPSERRGMGPAGPAPPGPRAAPRDRC